MKRQIGNSIYGLLDYAAYPVGMLLIAPTVLRNLGVASYGIWTIAMAVANVGAIVASGFGDAIIRQVATRRANGSRDNLLHIVRSAFAIHLLLGGLVSAGFYLMAPYLAGRLAVSDPGFRQICVSSTRIAAILVLIRAIETVCISVQRGFERYGAAVRVTVAARLLSLLATGMLASASYSVASIMAVTAGLAFGGLAVQLIILRPLVDNDSLRPEFDPAATRELFDFGKFTWILAITGVVFSQSDKIIGGAAVGASAVVAYALCAQIAQPVYGLTASGLHFLFPYIAFQGATNTPSKLRRIVLGAVFANVLLVAVGVGMLLAFSGPLLKILATDMVARDCANLLPVVIAASGVLALTVSGTYAMLALGYVRTLVVFNVAACLVMFVVMLLFLSRSGVWAVVDARLAFALVASLIYLPLFYRLGFMRLNARSGSMQGQLAGGEGA